MYKYKITNITDKNGVFKKETFEKLNEEHNGLTGSIIYPDLLMPGAFLLFEWDDHSFKFLHTSRIEKIYGKNNGCLEIHTRNSIYTLERINDQNA